LLDLNIKINDFKSEKIKMSFNLTVCKTIEEVSHFYIAGLMKSLIEINPSSSNKVHLSQASFRISDEVLRKDGLLKMLNGTIEKDHEQEKLKKKETDAALRKKGIKTKKSSQVLKSQLVLEEKKFEFDDNCSQELNEDDIRESEAVAAPSTSSSSSKIPSKKKKVNVKF
jgi:hypothetical protein